MLSAWKANLQMQSDIRVRAGFAPLAGIETLWGERDPVHVNTLDAFDGPDANPWRNVRDGAPILA